MPDLGQQESKPRVPPVRYWLLFSLPALISVVVDFWMRSGRLTDFSPRHTLYYLGAWVECSLVWGLLLVATVQRRRWLSWSLRAAFVVGYTFALGGQVYFFRQYNAYLNRDLSVFAANLADSVLNQLLADASGYLLSKAPFVMVSLALVYAAARWLRPRTVRRRRAATLAAPVALIGACFIPTHHRRVQASTPDALYLNAVGGFVATKLGLTKQSDQIRPRVRHSLEVPTLSPKPHPKRNIVVVVMESVRADAACSEFQPGCKLTPYTNRLFPERIGLQQLRALDSTTAISLAVLWSGIGPHEDPETMHSWPLLFDYANAAGWDTAFWTSQNLMFGNTRLWVKNLGARSVVSGTELDSTSDIDLGADEARLADYAISNWSQLKEPFLAVIQLSNTHYPYMVREDRPTPFQPSEFNKGLDGRVAFRNYYQNAVVQADQQLARTLQALRETEAGQRTVVLLTSDHGEAFRDHGQMGHTVSLFDEEIRVPGFVDAPSGTLTAEEEANLRSRRDQLTFHVDITPTVLDLMGVWQDPALHSFKVKMLGTSWLGEAHTTALLPMTNCAAVWSCAFENWGVMQGPLKLFARTPYDRGWQCRDVLLDPRESKRLHTPDCRRLEQAARQLFKQLPE